MKFTSQICTTKEQSERLLALGIKAETADMLYMQIDGYWVCVISQGDEEYIPYEDHLPAWSLHRLLCLLPTEYIYDIDFQQIMQDFIFRSQDMYDEVISCIETLSKEGYFYKEYLEEK
ncbi:MAG: hypothetical protein J6V21_08660 [Alistipes sp.]|nr:hypothetical protein [Alistipes sp.]